MDLHSLIVRNHGKFLLLPVEFDTEASLSNFNLLQFEVISSAGKSNFFNQTRSVCQLSLFSSVNRAYLLGVFNPFSLVSTILSPFDYNG